MSVVGRRVSFVYFDTVFLAYGKDGDNANKTMKMYFKNYSWTEADVLAQIEEMLMQN